MEGTLTGLLFIGFVIFLIYLSKRRAKKKGFEMYQTVFKAEVDYLQGVIADEYFYRLKSLAKSSVSPESFKNELEAIQNEMNEKGMDTTPLVALFMKIREDVK